MSIDLTRFHESFFAESIEGLDAAEAHLLAMEGAGAGEADSAERLNAIFRGIHSIKGAAGSLGFTAIASFTHHVESFLDGWRKGAEVRSDDVDAVLACVDQTRSMLQAAREGREAAPPPDQLLERLRGAGAQVSPTAEEGGGEHRPTRYRIRFEPGRTAFQGGSDPLKLLRVLGELGELHAKVDTSALPAEGFDAQTCYLAWTLELSSSAPRSEIDDVFAWVGEDGRVAIEEVAMAVEPAPEKRRHGDRRQTDRRAGGRRGDDSATEVRTDRLNVSRDKVDELINLVGELVITKTMMKQMVRSLDPEALARMESGIAQLERNARDLQESVLAIRMLPMSQAFGRFPRLVRDIAQRLGKLVRLEVTGGESELDKSVIEKLVDPLTHLVRNALDHAIETPAERRAAGKPETATISLHAEHKGGNIEIRVKDDGRGIDPERVAARARQMALIADTEEIGLERATELIFEAGFSTAGAVNDLSGRGVGLDVVRKNILALSGSIAVESARDVGTTFVIRLPLTLAIVDGMLVTVGEDRYIVPLAFIVECLQPQASRMKTIAGRGMLVETRGRYLPLLELGRLVANDAAAPFDRGILLVVESDGNQVALLVDALVGQEQVVVKSLESNYRKVSYIAGATILGEGRVVLILDVASLVRSARE